MHQTNTCTNGHVQKLTQSNCLIPLPTSPAAVSPWPLDIVCSPASIAAAFNASDTQQLQQQQIRLWLSSLLPLGILPSIYIGPHSSSDDWYGGHIVALATEGVWLFILSMQLQIDDDCYCRCRIRSYC